MYKRRLHYVDPHIRGALPEAFSFAAFPLSLWALDRLRRERPALLQAAELPDSLRAAYDELAESLQSIPPFAEYPAAIAAMPAAVDRLLDAVAQLPADRYDAHQVSDVQNWCYAV